MILQSLVRLAERQGLTANRGFNLQPVHWIIDIDSTGKVLGVLSTATRPEGAKKDVFTELSIPVRRPDKRGLKIAPDILVENGQYLLGLGDAKKPFKAERVQEAVDATLAELEPLQASSTAIKAQIVAQRWMLAHLEMFCRLWRGADAGQPAMSLSGEMLVHSGWASNHLFVFRCEDSFTTAIPAVRAWISARAGGSEDAGSSADSDLCLVTGKWAMPKRLLDGISLPGDTGKVPLVSFNLAGFWHYGHEYNENAPISSAAADAVFAALQYLLRPDSKRSVRLNGKTTVLFWSDSPPAEAAVDDLLGPCLDADPAAVRRIEMIYAAPQDGRPSPAVNTTPFCTLVLTREKMRISVRSALLSTVDQVAKHILRWFADLDLGHIDGRPYRAIWALAKATVSAKANDAEPVHDLMARLYLAAIAGAPLPTEAMAAVLRRIRAHDKDADSPSRIALIKATLIRSYQKETPVSLDPAHPDPAYHLGRLFALLEQIQDKATGAAAGIAERYLGAAMGTPALVFPRLLKLHHHHLAKIGGGLAVHFGKQIDAIVARLPPKLPATQALADQGTFMVGYHHQRAERFKPGSDASTSTPAKDQP